MKKIKESTGIAVGLLIPLAGGVFWLSVMWSQTKTNAEDISEIKRNHSLYLESSRNIDTRLGRIEGHLGVQ